MIVSPQAKRAIGPSGTLEEAVVALGALHHQDQAQLQLPPSHQVGLFSGNVVLISWLLQKITLVK